MRRIKLRKWVKVILVILVLIILVIINKSLDDDFVKDCIKGGNTKEYCEMEVNK